MQLGHDRLGRWAEIVRPPDEHDTPPSYSTGSEGVARSRPMVRPAKRAEYLSSSREAATAWVMLQAGKITEATIDALSKLCRPATSSSLAATRFWMTTSRRGKA